LTHLKAIVLFFLWSAFAANVLLAQSVNYFPDLSSSYIYAMSSADPAYVPTEGRADFAANYKFRTGAFKDISTFNFSAARIIRHENESAQQVVRVLLNNEQEGPYINTPKLLVNYVYSLYIAENTQLFSGLALGGTGLYFSAPSATTSILMPDGTLGLGISHRKASLAFSSFQLFNSKINPLLSTIRFARYYHLNFTAQKELGIDWKLNMYSLWRMLPDVQDEVSATFILEYMDALGLGSAYKNNAGLSFLCMFRVNTGEDKLLFSFVYNTPVFSPLPKINNSMELCVGYLFQ